MVEQEKRERLWNLGMVDETWQDILTKGYGDQQEEIETLLKYLETESRTCNPKKEDVFRSTRNIKWEDIRVIIIGHNPSDRVRSLGYAFGSDPVSQSLKDIDRYIKEELRGCDIKLPDRLLPDGSNLSGSLDGWISQGCFCINACLFISGDKMRYAATQALLTGLLAKIKEKRRGVVIIAFGGFAWHLLTRLEQEHLEENRVIRAPHPTAERVDKGNNTDFKKIKPFLQANVQLFRLKLGIVDFLGYDNADEERIQILRPIIQELAEDSTKFNEDFSSNLLP